VLTVVAWFVAVLVITTDAEGTAAPDASVTVPVMLPRSVCAQAANTNTTASENLRMSPPEMSDLDQYISGRSGADSEVGYHQDMPVKAVLSEEEYLRTSFPGVDQEYQDGELVERSVPDFFHSRVQLRLGGLFLSVETTHRLFAAPEVRLRPRPGRYIIPDVAVFWPEKPTTSIPARAPLIAIEILSADDRMADVRAKLQEYADWGVPHIWLVDPRLGLFYLFRDGLHEVKSFAVPEVKLEINPADVFDER
jgi:Uma2 family endonuclease